MSDRRRQLESLEAVLRRQLEHHTRLLKLMEGKRDALRRHQADRLADLCRAEHAVVSKISDDEKRRLTLVAELTLAVQPDAQQPLAMVDLAERLAEPDRTRLLLLRQQLREQMQEVQRRTTVVRRATDAVARHMTGLVQGIAAASAGVSTYGMRGARTRPAAAVSTFSVTG